MESQRRKRAMRREKNQCVDCGKDAEPNKARCRMHLDKHNDATRKKAVLA